MLRLEWRGLGQQQLQNCSLSSINLPCIYCAVLLGLGLLKGDRVAGQVVWYLADFPSQFLNKKKSK